MAGKLGIVAGGGTLPARLIEACRGQGREVYVVALEGHTDPAVVEGVDHTWIRLGAASLGAEAFHEAGVRELVMAGPVKRPSLRELRPDIRVARFLAKVGRRRALGDDSLLRAIVGALEEDGFSVIGIDDVLGDLIALPRCYGGVRPDDDARQDIARGAEVAKAIGALDIGQSVVVQQGEVLGVEAVEGTDALLKRCGELRRAGTGGVLVKMKKPAQERRADLPTIGPQTVRDAAAAGLRGIAVEAGGTLIVEPDLVAEEADRLGLFVLGIDHVA